MVTQNMVSGDYTRVKAVGHGPTSRETPNSVMTDLAAPLKALEARATASVAVATNIVTHHYEQ